MHKADVLGTEEECSVALLGLWGDLRFRLRFRGGKFGVEIEEKNKQMGKSSREIKACFRVCHDEK